MVLGWDVFAVSKSNMSMRASGGFGENKNPQVRCHVFNLMPIAICLYLYHKLCDSVSLYKWGLVCFYVFVFTLSSYKNMHLKNISELSRVHVRYFSSLSAVWVNGNELIDLTDYVTRSVYENTSAKQCTVYKWKVLRKHKKCHWFMPVCWRCYVILKNEREREREREAADC